MNQAPNVTDRVLWVAVPKEIRNNTGRLVTHTGSCECGAHAHANPYREADGTFSCPVLRTPLPLNGLYKYTPPDKITEGWPVQVDSNVAHYIGKANEMGLQGVHINPITVSDQRRGIVDVTYSRAEDEAIAAWKSRVAAVEKSECEHVKYELPRIGRSAEYSVKSHDEAIERRSKQRAAAQARLDVYRKAHAYYTQGQAPEKVAEKEPPRHVKSKPFDQLPVNSTFIFDTPLRGWATACAKVGPVTYVVGNDPAPMTIMEPKREVLVLQEAEPTGTYLAHALVSAFMGCQVKFPRHSETTKPEEPAQEPTPAPYHKMVSVRLDGDTVDHQADAQSHLIKGLVKIHNTETLNKLTPDNTRRTFGEVPIGAFFYYCSLEFEYNVAPGAAAWQRISHTEALPVAFIYRTDEDALKISPTKFGQGDIVAGVKVSE